MILFDAHQRAHTLRQLCFPFALGQDHATRRQLVLQSGQHLRQQPAAERRVQQDQVERAADVGEELQRLAVEGMRLYFLGILFSGFNIILSTFFTSTEQGPPAQAISLARGFVVILPAAFLLSALFQVTGVWLSYPAAEAITAVLGAALFARWKRMHRAEKQD